MPEAVHIGKAAKLASVSVDTIRFYQKFGLIKGADRSVGGYRLFEGEQIRDLIFVRHAQELGLSFDRSQEFAGVETKASRLSRSAINTQAKVGKYPGRRSTVSRDWKGTFWTPFAIAIVSYA